MITLSLDGYFRDVNPAMSAVLGWSADELTDVPFVDFLHPDDRERTLAEAARLFEGSTPLVSFENRYRAKNGDYRWMLWSARHDPDDGLLYAVAKDITERRRSEQAIRAREAELRSLVDASPIGIVVANTAGRIIEANQAFCSMSGWTPTEVAEGALRASDLTPPEWVDASRAKWDELRQTGSFNGLEKEYFTRDGGRVPVLLGATTIEIDPSIGADDSGLIAYFVLDLTEQKRAEAEIAVLNAGLEERVVECTAELEAFGYSVSHDLRAPLRAVTGFSGVLLNELGADVDPRHRHYLERISDNAESMGKLIDGLLTFSRLGRQGLEPVMVDPRPVIDRIFDDLAPDLAGRDVNVTIDDLPEFHGDRELIGLVFENLIANAVKFTSTKASACITITGSQTDGGITYSVADNGVGFDPTYGDKLFRVFQRLHNANEFEGTGVGLAIVARIVQRHGGSVQAIGTPGEGATVQFWLPDDDPHV